MVSGTYALGASNPPGANSAIARRRGIAQTRHTGPSGVTAHRGCHTTPRATDPAVSTPTTSKDSRVQDDFDALWQWLESNGVDVSKTSPKLMDDADGGRQWGLVAAKDLGSGEAVLQVPETLWMTKDTALKSPVGALLQDQPAWVLLGCQLLHEKSINEKSKWNEYIKCLPGTLSAPLFWTAEELGQIAGSQLFQNAAGYDSYVRGTFNELKQTVFGANPTIFPSDVFTESEFLWAFGTLRARCLPPRDSGDEISLIPGLDMANHSGLMNAVWTLNGGGLGSVFGGAGSGNSMLFRTDSKTQTGEECLVNYGPAKVDSQFALDFGFCDAFCARPGYVLGPIAIPETDVNAFDKGDVLEVAGLLQAPSFTLRAFEDPPNELRIFARLLNVKDEDAFLLEAIFRQEAWGLIFEPVSKSNEQEACTTMIGGCEVALSGYPTRVDEDRAVAEDPAQTARARLAARVVMGEKQALTETLGYFMQIEGKLEQMEYYQERRLRSLNLLDRDGNSTYDPFEDTMA